MKKLKQFDIQPLKKADKNSKICYQLTSSFDKFNKLWAENECHEFLKQRLMGAFNGFCPFYV